LNSAFILGGLNEWKKMTMKKAYCVQIKTIVLGKVYKTGNEVGTRKARAPLAADLVALLGSR
jgi:hypothetical protein